MTQNPPDTPLYISGSGDSGHSMLDPFLDCWLLTGYRPAWEGALRMGHGMAQVRSGSWRYLSNPIAGLARLYTHTHDPEWKRHADRIWTDLCDPDRNMWFQADHGNRMVLWCAPPNPKVDQAWTSWSPAEEPSGRSSASTCTPPCTCGPATSDT